MQYQKKYKRQNRERQIIRKITRKQFPHDLSRHISFKRPENHRSNNKRKNSDPAYPERKNKVANAMQDIIQYGYSL